MLCRNCGKAEREHGVASGRCPTQHQDESTTHWKAPGRESDMYGVQGIESCPGCLGDGAHWETCYTKSGSLDWANKILPPREQAWRRPAQKQEVVVNPKFHAALKKMAEIHDKKSSDYATDQNRYANFEYAAKFAGVTVEQVFDVLIGVKQARLLELLGSGKTPKNESVEDTRLDQAVYTVLKYSYFHGE